MKNTDLDERAEFTLFWKRPPRSPWTASVRKKLHRAVGRHAHAAVWEAIEHAARRSTDTEPPDLSRFLDLPDKQVPAGQYDVLFVSNAMLPPRGGGTRSFLHVARLLVESGLRVAAVCGGPALKSFEWHGIDFSWVVHEDDLRDTIGRFQFSRIFCQQEWSPVAAEEAARSGKGYWYFLRSIEDLTPSRDGVFGVEEIAADILAGSKKAVAALISGAEMVVANSHFMARLVKAAYDRESAVVYPGIDLPEPWEKQRTALSQYVVSMGGSTKKGIEIVLNLAKANPGEHFLICGVKQPPAWLPVKLFPANVSWLGQLDPSAAYALAKVVLMPSLWPEPAGRVCPEALMRGIPVLASQVGGITEIVSDKDFLVEDFTNAEAWKGRLREILAKVSSQEMREKALRRGETYAEMQKLPPEVEAALRKE